MNATVEASALPLPRSSGDVTGGREEPGTDLGVYGRPVPARDVLSLSHGGYTILLGLRTERYLVLDEVGTYVWSLIVNAGDDGISLPGIVESLSGEFDAPRALIERDVGSLIDHLRLDGVIEGVARGCPLPRPPTLSGLQCAFALAGAVLTLRVLGLRRSIAIARLLASRVSTVIVPTPEFLADAVRKVDTIAAFFPGRALCLEQSFALFVVLRRAGIGVRLRIGAQPFPFAAHAWVEYQGRPVGESFDRVDKFVPFEGLGV